MEELENKVLKEKYTPIPITVNKEFKSIIQKCLQKKIEARPTIEEIIFDDTFQRKCQFNRITLPLSLNKAKQKHKGIDEGDVSMEFQTEVNAMAVSSRSSRLKVNQVEQPSKPLTTSTDKPKTSPRTQLSSRRETVKVNTSAGDPKKAPVAPLTKKASEAKKFIMKPEVNRSSKLKPTVPRKTSGKTS